MTLDPRRAAQADAKAARARAKALRPWYRKKRWWVAGALGLIVLFSIIGAAAKGKNGNGGTVTTQIESPAAVTGTGTVLYQNSGQGDFASPNFTAPSNWSITYDYDCTQAFNGSGNFIVQIDQNGTGSAASAFDQPINLVGPIGNGTVNYHFGGELYLQVLSECTWSIKATGD